MACSESARGALALASMLALGACTGAVTTSETDAAARRDAAAPDAHTPADVGVPTDAGSPPDAATVDASIGRDAGMHLASCPPGALLCESFEDGTALDSSRWNVMGDDGVFLLDTTSAADGARSLHVRYGAPYGATGEQAIVTRDTIAAPADRVYVRAYMRFESLALPGAHPFFVSTFDGDAWLAFGSIINDFALMAVGNGLDNPQPWYEGGTGMWHPGVEDGDDTPLEENGLHAGDWICVELMAFGGGADSSAERSTVSMNGTAISDMVATDERWGFPSAPRWSPRYDGSTWRFGVESFGPENVALDMWFDAIVISNEPIGCLP